MGKQDQEGKNALCSDFHISLRSQELDVGDQNTLKQRNDPIDIYKTQTEMVHGYPHLFTRIDRYRDVLRIRKPSCLRPAALGTDLQTPDVPSDRGANTPAVLDG
jgi:hypothetical protein